MKQVLSFFSKLCLKKDHYKQKNPYLLYPPPISRNWCFPWTKYRFSYIWWILPPIREYKILLFYSFNSFISSSHTSRYISNYNICIHSSSHLHFLLLVLFRRCNCTVPLPTLNNCTVSFLTNLIVPYWYQTIEFYHNSTRQHNWSVPLSVKKLYPTVTRS